MGRSKPKRPPISLKGMYRATRNRVICKMCMTPISKSGHIRYHFDTKHRGVEPVLLKESEWHLYHPHDEDETATVKSRYGDETNYNPHDLSYCQNIDDITDQTTSSLQNTPNTPTAHFSAQNTHTAQSSLGQKRRPPVPAYELQTSLQDVIE